MSHSEKQALAYALLVASEDDGNAIRIVKNLKIANCYMFMCGASRVIGREIIVRDNLRFHQFRDGFCSCSLTSGDPTQIWLTWCRIEDQVYCDGSSQGAVYFT